MRKSTGMLEVHLFTSFTEIYNIEKIAFLLSFVKNNNNVHLNMALFENVIMALNMNIETSVT